MFRRIVSRYFDLKYALDMSRMTVQEAKGILDLPPGGFTKEDLGKAYRVKAIQNHPDHGGDLEMMKAVNLAKDKLMQELEGGGRPRWEPVNPPSAPPRPPPVKWQDDPETVIVGGQDFSTAWSSSGAPPGTEWKFVSVPVYYWGENGNTPGESIYTLYGVTADKHVFLAFKHRAEGAGVTFTKKYGPKTHFNDDWQTSEVSVPFGGDPLKVIPKHIKMTSTAWADATPKPPTKFIAWPGGHPTAEIFKKMAHHGGVPLKDILVGTGVVQEGTAGVAGRKSQVEIITLYNREKYHAIRELFRAKKIPHMSTADGYDFVVRINGKEQKLGDDTVKKMERLFIPMGIGWDKVDDKRITNLTKMRGGALKMDASAAIRVLVDCLTNEPSWVHIALEKAAEEYEPESKTAGVLRLASQMTTEDLSYLTGVSTYDLFRQLAG